MSSGTWEPPIGGKQRHEKDTAHPNEVLTYRHGKQTLGGRARALVERGGSLFPATKAKIVDSRATGFASPAMVLSFVAGDAGKGASNVQVQAKIGRDRPTSVNENSGRRDPTV